MDIITFPLGQMQANCYVLVQDKECILIDPADDAVFLLEEIQRRNLHLKGMIATHGHFDHIMAVGEIQLSYQIPLYLNLQDMFLVERLEETATHFLGQNPVVIKPQIICEVEMQKINISSIELEIISVPGHTPGSICIYNKQDEVLFTGDTLFHNAIGRYDFSYSDKKKLKESLIKILDFPVVTKIYPGHGSPTTVGDEKDILSLFPLV